MDQCYFCKGKVESKEIRHVHQWGDRVFIFKNVPADVCTQCGERYFGPGALAQMDQIATGETEPEDIAHIPVYTLALTTS